MKKDLNLLLYSALVAIVFSASAVVYSTEEKYDGSMPQDNACLRTRVIKCQRIEIGLARDETDHITHNCSNLLDMYGLALTSARQSEADIEARINNFYNLYGETMLALRPMAAPPNHGNEVKVLARAIVVGTTAFTLIGANIRTPVTNTELLSEFAKFSVVGALANIAITALSGQPDPLTAVIIATVAGGLHIQMREVQQRRSLINLLYQDVEEMMKSYQRIYHKRHPRQDEFTKM